MRHHVSIDLSLHSTVLNRAGVFIEIYPRRIPCSSLAHIHWSPAVKKSNVLFRWESTISAYRSDCQHDPETDQKFVDGCAMISFLGFETSEATGTTRPITPRKNQLKIWTMDFFASLVLFHRRWTLEGTWERREETISFCPSTTKKFSPSRMIIIGFLRCSYAAWTFLYYRHRRACISGVVQKV